MNYYGGSNKIDQSNLIDEKSIPELILTNSNTDDIIQIIQKNLMKIQIDEEYKDEINKNVKELIIKLSKDKLETKEKLNTFKDLVKAVIKHNLSQIKSFDKETEEILNLVDMAGDTNKKLLVRLAFSKLALV